MSVKTEAERITNELLHEAKERYSINEFLRTFFTEAEDPEYISTKTFALNVCDMLISLNIQYGEMKEGSIAHKLGLRLLDYIERTEIQPIKKL